MNDRFLLWRIKICQNRNISVVKHEVVEIAHTVMEIVMNAIFWIAEVNSAGTVLHVIGQTLVIMMNRRLI